MKTKTVVRLVFEWVFHFGRNAGIEDAARFLEANGMPGNQSMVAAIRALKRPTP